MFIINFCRNMFRTSLCPSSGEQWPCYCIWCVVLVLLDVVGSGCGALCCRMRALWRFLFISLLLTSVSTCFGHHYAHLQENKGSVTAFGVLFWFCWMWLVAVVGALCCRMRAVWRFLFNYRYQSHPAEPELTKCSNRTFVLLKMDIMLPETCWDRS